MDPRREWPADEPPDGFADRVMAAIEAEAPAEGGVRPERSRARRLGIVSALALAAGVALAVGWRASLPAAHGEAIAADRTQVQLGPRATAVLEPGARVAWSGDVVKQESGDVFYRVEPGSPFRVHTAAGDVEVLGTCFRVKTFGSEDKAMNVRDVKAGAIGAALGAVALVSVYEGKVAVSQAKESVTLTAGESARADGAGVRRGGAGSLEEDGRGGDEPKAAASDDPLLAANANLADSVREYKRQLESISTDKKTVEKRLAEAEEKLAAAENGGTAPPKKSEYDLTQDDWKRLAAEGKVNAHYPCLHSGKGVGDISKEGFSPEDAKAIDAAMDASRKRLWQQTLRPACTRALKGEAALADRLGPETCQEVVRDIARQSGEDVEEEMRQVAEIRAGMRPMPADGGGEVLKMMLALTLESGLIEKDLAKSMGPDDAHRAVFGNEVGCWQNSTFGVDPRPTLPPLH